MNQQFRIVCGCITFALSFVTICRQTTKVKRDIGKFQEPFSVTTIEQKATVDDSLLVTGRSCLRVGNTWDCRDCRLHSIGNPTMTRAQCPMMIPNNICNTFPRVAEWDAPPRMSSIADVTSATYSHRHILTHYGMNEKYEQMPCETIEDCFTMTKCSPDKPMKVFAHGTGLAHDLVTLAVKRYPQLLVQTLQPADACLLIVTCDSYLSASELYQNWNGSGRNHFVWEASRCFGAHPDRPYDTMVNYQYAALATGSLMDANVRRGYDVPLTRLQWAEDGTKPRQFRTPVLPEDNTSRKYLLSFKGNIFAWPQIWWQHRWLATEYWDRNDTEVLLDTVCKGWGKDQYTHERDTFGALLLNSTFGFAPGGGGSGSYRFSEVLGLGGIPVVLPDFLPPMWPDLDWSGCMVRVSEARIVDLPHILRSISKDEVRYRQQRCKVLFKQTIGWVKVDNENLWEIDSGEQAFMTSMKVWYWRIQDYFERQKQQVAMEAMNR
jgi:Exostosin family